MAQEWYVQAGGEVLGPLGSEGIRSAVRDGAITAETLVRLGPEGDWHKAAAVKGMLPPQPPVPPVAPGPITAIEITDAEIDSTFQPSDAAVSKAVETLKNARKRGWAEFLVGDEPDTPQKSKPPGGCESVIIILLCLGGWLFSIFFAFGGKTDIHIGLGAVTFFLASGIAVLHSCLHALYEILNELRKRNAD